MLAAHAIGIRAADGILDRLGWSTGQALLSHAFFLFLLLLGFTALSWIGLRQGSLRQANALPRRATALREWSVGASVGWAALLLAVLPMMLVGALHPQFLWSAPAWGASALSILALAVAALANEVAFRGFVFRRLIDSVGPTAATLVLSLLYAVLGSLRPNATGLSFFITLIAGILFSLAYLRTHALWLGWGLHFAWAASMAILFGLPAGGVATYSVVIQTGTTGPDWFTGGAYGPEGGLFTIAAFLFAMFLLYKATREFAWDYTHEPIVPGGYPMDVPPPAAHTAMEQQSRPPALVQINPAPSSIADDSPPDGPEA